MKVTQERLPASQIGLEIEITPEMSKQAYEKTLQEFMRAANIPGFRKGKVPRQVLIQRFGSTRIKAAVIEDLIEDSLKKAVEQENLNAIGNFQLRSSFDELIEKFEPGSAFSFSAAVDIPPEAKLTDYKGLSVKVEDATYDVAKIDETLERYRNQSATLVPVDNRSAQKGDVAVVDFKGYLAAEGDEDPQEIPGGSATDFQIELVEGRFIEGFIDGIIGMALEETKDISVTFPDDYPQAEIAGQPATFTITLKELKEKELPELDDEFAQEYSDFETLAEWRESLEKNLRDEADRKIKANKERALLDELVKHLDVEIPETLARQEVDYMLTQTAMQLSSQGLDIKRIMTKELISQMRQQSRPEAINRIKRTLALGEVAKLESIKVEPTEAQVKIDEILEEYADQAQEIDQDRLRQSVEEDLLKDKVLSWLEENGTVELVPEGSLAQDADAESADVEDPSTSSEAVVAPVSEPEIVESEAVASEAEVVSSADEPEPSSSTKTTASSKSKSPKAKKAVDDE